MSAMSIRIRRQTGVKIERPTFSTGATGRQTRTWTTVSTSSAWSVQPLGERLAQQIFGRAIVGESIGYCDYSTDVRAGDRITVASVAFEALAAVDEAGRGHHWAVALRHHAPGEA